MFTDIFELMIFKLMYDDGLKDNREDFQNCSVLSLICAQFLQVK